ADDLRGHLHVGIGQNNDWILGAPLTLRTLSLLSRAGIDVARHGRRTNEADRTHAGIVNERIDCDFAAIDKIDDTLWQTGLLEQLVNVAHGERHALRWLKDESVPGCDRVGQEPES